MSSEAVTKTRRKRKEILVHLCGDACNLCGYNTINSALEFHHLFPEQKLYGLRSGNCRNLKTDIDEVKKCILVCANCHREIHSGLYQVDELLTKRLWNSQYEKRLLETKPSQIFCKECGIPITKYSSSGLCAKCHAKTTRVVQRPSREELKILIRTQPFTAIGKQFHVSDKTITKWCKAVNLPCRKKDINQLTDAQWSEI